MAAKVLPDNSDGNYSSDEEKINDIVSISSLPKSLTRPPKVLPQTMKYDEQLAVPKDRSKCIPTFFRFQGIMVFWWDIFTDGFVAYFLSDNGFAYWYFMFALLLFLPYLYACYYIHRWLFSVYFGHQGRSPSFCWYVGYIFLWPLGPIVADLCTPFSVLFAPTLSDEIRFFFSKYWEARGFSRIVLETVPMACMLIYLFHNCPHVTDSELSCN